VRRAQRHKDADAFDMVLRGQVALNDARRWGIHPRKTVENYYRQAAGLESDNPDTPARLGLV
jgi:hypothetical protein